MSDRLTQITPSFEKNITSSANAMLTELPLAENLKAGFPSPAADYAGDRIDIVREIVRHPETTFYARVEGESMIEAGIFPNDLVVVDRSLTAKNGDFIVAFIDGEFTLKEYRFDAEKHCVILLPHNSQFMPIYVTADQQFKVWGVVTHSIHKTR